MIQKMYNEVPINMGMDMTDATDIVVSVKQAATNTDATFTGESLELVGTDQLIVKMPKSFCMGLAATFVNVQVAFTIDGLPGATDVFKIPVRKLQMENGYGD